jgi:hypothetical protein
MIRIKGIYGLWDKRYALLGNCLTQIPQITQIYKYKLREKQDKRGLTQISQITQIKIDKECTISAGIKGTFYFFFLVF